MYALIINSTLTQTVSFSPMYKYTKFKHTVRNALGYKFLNFVLNWEKCAIISNNQSAFHNFN